MHDFHYKGDELFCEEVSIQRIVEQVGTPCYIYSHQAIHRQFHDFDDAFKDIHHIVAYAMKANSNIGVLRVLAKEGSGADIVSGGELFRTLKAGVPSNKIVFAGVGKSPEEIRYALESDILMFNVESSGEVQQINEVAQTMGIRARVALRINPDIDPQTHPYISTGLKKSKFGIAADHALKEFELANKLAHIEVVGVHCHIGSQLTQVTPFVDAIKKVLSLIKTLQSQDVNIRFMNIGGGLGITYSDETPPHPNELAAAIIPLLQTASCQIIMEPGRSIVGNAGILVTKVLYNKEGANKQFVIVDAAMNDLLRPSLYEAHHDIQPVLKNESAPVHAVDVVGPICESGDFLAKDRKMPQPQSGDLLAVMSAGAYGFTMASNYNSRPKTPEVLVKDKQIMVIRKRESYEDLIRGESIPEIFA